jgi:hypothetical protein
MPKAKQPNVTTGKASPKRSKGRPKGSKNKIASALVLNTEMTQVKSMLNTIIPMISSTTRLNPSILFMMVYLGIMQRRK